MIYIIYSINTSTTWAHVDGLFHLDPCSDSKKIRGFAGFVIQDTYSSKVLLQGLLFQTFAGGWLRVFAISKPQTTANAVNSPPGFEHPY